MKIIKNKPCYHSFIRTIAHSLLLILLLVFCYTFFSISMLAASLNDAAIINTAGSLRMQAYRIAYANSTNSTHFYNYIQQFNDTLHSPMLQSIHHFLMPERIQQHYRSVLTQWHEIQPFQYQKMDSRYIDNVESFTDNIGKLVLELQKHAESKLKTLALISSVALFIILLIIIYLIHFTQIEIVHPLKKLMLGSYHIETKKVNRQLVHKKKEGLNCITDNLMSIVNNINSFYTILENEIKEKTKAITKANLSLNLLFTCSHHLSSRLPDKHDFEHILHLTLSIEGISALQFWIEQSPSPEWRLQVGMVNDSAWTTENIMLDDTYLGTLKWQGKIEREAYLVLKNIMNMLARAIYFTHTQRQSTYLAIMEERAVLARELHDSIAQSLSYLKIQTTLLQRQHQYNDNQKSRTITDQISRELKTTYDQLRELINAFRLSYTYQDIEHGIKQIINQLYSQSTARIHIEGQCCVIDINENNQIHLLNIIREALSNAVKHAHASEIKVIFDHHDSNFCVTISDNGIGFDQNDVHYSNHGLHIMKERARLLNASLFIHTQKNQGSQICLRFESTSNTTQNT